MQKLLKNVKSTYLGSNVKLGQVKCKKCYRKVKSKQGQFHQKVLNKNSNFVNIVDPEKTFKFTMTFFSVGFIVF